MTVPKHVSRDCELSTTGVAADGRGVPSWDATQQMLRQIDAAFEPLGTATWSRHSNGGHGGYASAYSVDCLRHWSPCGQCYYSDMSHLEVCTAEVRSPRAFAAQCLSTLRVAEEARRRAEEESRDADRYSLSAANIDVLDPSVSWGAHLNVAVAPSLWEDLLVEPRHPAVLGFVASALAAAVPFFGAGYLLPLKDGSVIYSLSGRAHHLSRIRTLSTTEAFGRGLLNSRREPHGEGHDRLHLIAFDYSLAAAALMACFLQCSLAAAEEGFCGLNLYDPIRAMRTWSWHLDVRTGRLTAAAALVDGRRVTLFRYVRELCETMLRMCESGLIGADVAPEADELLPRIIELTHQAERGAIAQCAPHLDWAAKLLYLTDFCSQEGVPLQSAAARLADHDFANTDPDKGAFWQLWEAGCIDPLVDRDDVEACLADGPAETRAWARGKLIQEFYDDISDVDWSYVELQPSAHRWGPRLKIELPQLDSLNRDALAPLLDQAENVEQLEQLLQHEDDVVTDRADPVLDIRSQLAPAPDPDRMRRGRDGRP